MEKNKIIAVTNAPHQEDILLANFPIFPCNLPVNLVLGVLRGNYN